MRGRTRRGAALLLTLWCISVVAVTVVLVARMVDADVDGESTRSRRFEARELAFTGIAHGMNPGLKRDSELFRQKREDGSAIVVRVTSENARLNINLLLREPGHVVLKRLFEIWGVPEDEARVAIDSLTDWTDEDDLRQLNGAERDNLRNQTQYSLPMNRNFLSVSEMRRVRGMDAIAKYNPQWKESFSVFSAGQVDVQDAPSDVLQAAGGLSRDQAATLVEFRNGEDALPGTADDRVIASLDEVIQRVGLNGGQADVLRGTFAIGGEPTRVESTAWAGGIPYCIFAVINRQKKALCLSWEEQ